MRKPTIEERKLEYWYHFTDKTQKGYRPRNITDLRLGQLKESILNDADFWNDLMTPTGAEQKTPDELIADSDADYRQTRSKFWTMTRKKIEEHLSSASIRRSEFSKRRKI